MKSIYTISLGNHENNDEYNNEYNNENSGESVIIFYLKLIKK